MKKIVLSIIKLYQKRPVNQANCRFRPTCSQYGYEAVERYGIVKGGGLLLKRIFRCHPLSSGGYDPVPARN